MKEETVSAVPVNSIGGSSSTPGTGGIVTYDPILQRSKKLFDIVRRIPLRKLRKKNDYTTRNK